jgi:hypothetical protein
MPPNLRFCSCIFEVIVESHDVLGGGQAYRTCQRSATRKMRRATVGALLRNKLVSCSPAPANHEIARFEKDGIQFTGVRVLQT